MNNIKVKPHKMADKILREDQTRKLIDAALNILSMIESGERELIDVEFGAENPFCEFITLRFTKRSLSDYDLVTKGGMDLS